MDAKLNDKKLKVRKGKEETMKAYFIDFDKSAGDFYVSVLSTDVEQAITSACKLARVQWKVGMSASNVSRQGRVYFVQVSYNKLGGKKPGSTNSQVQNPELQGVENVPRGTLDVDIMCTNCGNTLPVSEMFHVEQTPTGQTVNAWFCGNCYVPF